MTLEHVKRVGDAAAGSATMSALMGWLPHDVAQVSAFFGLVYILIRISETRRFVQFVSWLRAAK